MYKLLRNYKNLIIVAIAIILTAPIVVEAEFMITDFVFALDVVVLNVCVYYFIDVFSPMQLAFVAAIFSPLSRCFSQMLTGSSFSSSIAACAPDAIFFFSYGVILSILLRNTTRTDTLVIKYAVSVAVADILSNYFEILFMMMNNKSYLSHETVTIVALMGVSRAIASVSIAKMMDVYSETKRARETERNNRYIINQCAFLTDELSLLKSNRNDVEMAVKDAYELYRELNENELTKEYANKLLGIAMATHEIKGGYNGLIDAITNLLVDTDGEQLLKLSEILAYDKADAKERGRSRNITLQVNINQKIDFYVKDAYKIISIIRNLTANAVEAMVYNTGTIDISVELLSNFADGGVSVCHFEICDDGPGIPKELQKNVYLAGFSTKMNESNGYMQRGLGLALVKQYVEDEFGGSLAMESSPELGTKFYVDIPIDNIEGEVKWIYM